MAIDFVELAKAGKSAVIQARNGLIARRNVATAEAERDELTDQIDILAGILADINQAQLMEVAIAVGRAADELGKIVDGVKLKPMDAAIQQVVAAFSDLSDVRSDIHKQDALPPSEPPAPQPPGPPPPLLVGGQPSISTARDFASLRAEYDAFFEACAIRPERQGNIDYYLNSITNGKARYQGVAGGMSVPWYFIGILHGMEAGFNFNRHLHNGDPLTARTARVPAGHPATGSPPFSWHDSAVDAVKLKKLHAVTDWGVPRMLYLFESFNGFGYRPMKLPSPYLWSFSNLYVKGKYVADGVYDPNAGSEQCGAAVILKAGKDRGLFV